MTITTIKGWQRILLLILPYFIIVGSFSLVGAFLAGVGFSNPDMDWSSEQHLIMTFFNLLGTFLILWIFMKFVDKEKFIKIGLGLKTRIPEIAVGIALGFAIMGSGYLLLLAIDEIDFQNVIFKLKELIISFLLFVMVALVEEALFRGYILKNLMASFNKYIALAVSAVIFSLAHGANPNIDLFSLIDLFLAGIFLGISYIHTKNLWFPIALHFSWNFFQTLLGFNVSGQEFYSLLEFTYSKGNLLNGGAFGFEGSILSVIAEVICIAAIVYYYSFYGLSKSLKAQRECPDLEK